MLLIGTVDFTLFLYLFGALLISLSVHEASHALAAYWLGDPTPKNAGRLSLNPMAHLEPLGVVMILLVGLGWGKPVQIDAEKLKPGPKIGMALVAAAGPLSNILLAVALSIPLRLHWLRLYGDIRVPPEFLTDLPAIGYIGLGPFVQWIVWLSLALAVFNLIPMNPLDGSRLWQIILPTEWYYRIARVEIVGLFFMIGLILADRFLGTNIIAGVIFPPVEFLWRALTGMTPPIRF